MTINIPMVIHECDELKALHMRITRIKTDKEYALLQIGNTSSILVKYCPGCGEKV